MERDGRCVRDIEARERALGRDAAEAVACLSSELAQAFALGPKHQGEGEGQCRGLERLGSFLGKSDPQESCLAKLNQALRQIPNQNDGHDIERAACRLGERASEGGRMPLGQHDARRPEGSGRTQRRADILSGSVTWSARASALQGVAGEAEPGGGASSRARRPLVRRPDPAAGRGCGSASSTLTPRAFSAGSSLRAAFSVASSRPMVQARVAQAPPSTGIDAIQQDADRTRLSAGDSGPSPAWAKAVLRLFWAWQGGENLSGLRLESAR